MIERGTLSIPEAAGAAAGDAALESLIERMAAAAPMWAATPPAELARLVEACRTTTAMVATEWVEAACRAKGITLGTPTEGEEWQSGPWALLRNLRLLQRSLEDLSRGSKPRLPGGVRPLSNGQVAVPVFPVDRWDQVLFGGVTAEVWMEPGIDRDAVALNQASTFDAPPEPSVSVVLGAGNISSIAPMDGLYKLLVERSTVIVKTNPVNEYLTEIFEHALRPLVEHGVLAFIRGGSEVGSTLIEDPRVTSVHLTGSNRTYDSIVFGSGRDGAAAKAAGSPRLQKRVTAELGNVTPVIIVPGPWTERDVAYQAENLAVTVMHNAGFNCIASRVFVQQAGWEHRHTLLDRIEAVFRETPVRHAYYPGTVERHQRFIDAYPQARQVGETDGVPWTLIPDVDAEASGELCFDTEVFAALAAEVVIDEESPARYLAKAVEFANERLWGTLGASIMIHPDSLDDPVMVGALERAIADLHYGTVAVNAWTGFGYAMTSTPWGAYPGHTPADIQSGVGVVHNTFMLGGTQKSVIRSPFRVSPKPTWFPSHRTAHEVLAATTHFEAEPSVARLTRTLGPQLRA